MTPQTFDERMDEVLHQLVRGVQGSQDGTTESEAKAKLRTLFKEMGEDAVGDDLPIGDEIAGVRSYTGERIYNKRNAEIRTKLATILGGSK